MATLLTNKIASMTEMREPHKVLENSGGRPVAILKNSSLVGYFVPAAAVTDPAEIAVSSVDEVRRAILSRKSITEPVRQYLRDK